MQLDRRISSEAAALAEAGYDVTILSLPVELDGHTPPPEVRIVMPPVTAGGAAGPLERYARRTVGLMPWPLYRAARRVYRKFRPVDDLHLGFFLSNVPGGPWHFIHCHDLDTLPAAR